MHENCGLAKKAGFGKKYFNERPGKKGANQILRVEGELQPCIKLFQFTHLIIGGYKQTCNGSVRK